MSNLIEEANLLQENKKDLVEALNEVGIPVTMATPLSRLAKCLKWAAGYGGCPIATIEKSTGRQRLFAEEEWGAMSASQKGNYEPIGVCLLAEGRALIIAKADAEYSNGNKQATWSTEKYDVPGLKNYSGTATTSGFYDDFDGEGKTDLICQRAADSGATYAAAQLARAYKAYEGDPTNWHLGDVSEWTLLNRFRERVDAVLYALFGVELSTEKDYWTSDEAQLDYSWHVDAKGAVSSNNSRSLYGYYVRPFALADMEAIVGA